MSEFNEELQQVSAKLSLLIRLTIASSERFSKLKAAEALEMVGDMNFSSQDIADMFGIPVKTIRNVRPQLKTGKKNEK